MVVLYIGQSQVIRPLISVDRDAVATAIVGAIDQDAAHAHVAHLGEG
jgi:hypothetical protein